MKKKKVRITSDIYLKEFKEFTQYIIDSTQKKQEFLNEISIKKIKIENLEYTLQDLYDMKSKLEMEISELKSCLHHNRKRVGEDLNDFNMLTDSYYNSEEIDLSKYGIMEKVLSKGTFKKLLSMLKLDLKDLKESKDYFQKKLNEKKDELNRTNVEIEYTELERSTLRREICETNSLLEFQNGIVLRGKKRIKRLGKKMYNDKEIKN